MRLSFASVCFALCSTAASAATLNGTYVFGTLMSPGTNMQIEGGGYRACSGGSGSTIVRGDGGLKMRIAFGSVSTQAGGKTGSTSSAVFGGYAMLTLTGEIGTGQAPNNGTLAFGTRGQGFLNGPSTPRTFPSTFSVTNYKIRDVGKTTVFSFDVDLNTFGTCKVSVTGTIPLD